MKRARGAAIVCVLMAGWSSMLEARASTYSDFASLHSDVMELMKFRTEARQDYLKIARKTRNRQPLNGLELNLIHTAVVERTHAFNRMTRFVLDHERILQRDPSRLNASEQRLFLRVLGTTLTLADVYLAVLSGFHDDNRLRRIVNEGESVIGKRPDELKRHLRRFMKRRHVRTYAAGITAYLRTEQPVPGLAGDPEVAYWSVLIRKSLVFSILGRSDFTLGSPGAREEDSIEGELLQRLRYRHKPQDLYFKLTSEIIESISQLFGNATGLVQWRSGKLKGNPDVAQDLKSTLRPLDILLEKTPFRLTDILIPGYWGHVAVWLGTEPELKALGIWDHPAFVPLHARIREGAGIIQALRHATTVDPVERFLDVDSLAVLRLRETTAEETRKRLIVAASQYGKRYDFNFDVETQHRLVCSELIFMSFLDMEWKTETQLGRWTINPDAVAERGRPGDLFEVVTLYVGGERQVFRLEEKMAYILRHSKKSDWKLLHGLRRFDVSP